MTYIKVDAQPVEDKSPKFSLKILVLLLIMIVAIGVNIMVFANADNTDVNVSADITNTENIVKQQ